MSTLVLAGLGHRRVLDQLEHLGAAPARRSGSRAWPLHDYGFARVRRRHDAHRGRIHRLRRRRDARPAAATGCSAARPCTSRSPRRSSPRRASSGRSATTSATRSTRCCTRAGSSRTTSSTCPAARRSSGRGRYHRDINLRDTLQTDLNVFEDFEPKLSEASRAADVLFLANIQPDLQREVREQCDAARFVAMDSMNLWIDIAHAVAAADDRAGRLPDPQRRRAQAADGRAQPDPRRAPGARPGAARRDRQAGRVRLGDVHARRLLRPVGLPDGRTSSSRPAPATPSRAASSATSPPTRARSTTPRCGARWPTARRAPPSTSRASAASGSTRSTRGEIDARVAELAGVRAPSDALPPRSRMRRPGAPRAP